MSLSDKWTASESSTRVKSPFKIVKRNVREAILISKAIDSKQEAVPHSWSEREARASENWGERKWLALDSALPSRATIPNERRLIIREEAYYNYVVHVYHVYQFM